PRRGGEKKKGARVKAAGGKVWRRGVWREKTTKEDPPKTNFPPPRCKFQPAGIRGPTDRHDCYRSFVAQFFSVFREEHANTAGRLMKTIDRPEVLVNTDARIPEGFGNDRRNLRVFGWKDSRTSFVKMNLR